MCRLSLVELPHYVSHGGKKCRRLCSVLQGVNDVAWDPDDRYLATASDDKTLLLWAVETGEKLRSLEGHTNFVFCCAFNPKQSSLVRSPQRAPPWPLLLANSCQRTKSCRVRASPGPCHLRASHSCSRFGSSVSYAACLVQHGLPHPRVECAENRKACYDKCSQRTFSSSAATERGARQVSGSFDETVCVWEAKTGQQIKACPGGSGCSTQTLFGGA